MPRPKNNILHDLFEKNDANLIICNKGNCTSKVLSTHTGNLERHLKSLHPDIYSEYIQKKCEKINNPSLFKKKTVTVELNRTNIELAIVDLFTRNGRPLHMAEDYAFKMLMQPMCDAIGYHVNERNIHEKIIAFSQDLKLDIKKDLKGKLISLKIDAATRLDLSVLGINVQYLKNHNIQVKTLALKELKSSHTGEYLKTVILEVLKEYSIDIAQILTITTDNGANMVKAVKDLNSNLQSLMEEEDDDSNSEDEDVDSNFTEAQMESLQSDFASYTITGIRCGAHTVQLCVYDVIKNIEIKNKLDQCRSVVKKLRTPTYLNILKKGRYKKPILDCPTRWNSTFNMIERLLEIKDIIMPLSKENPSLHLTCDEWTFVKEFIATFKPIYTATIKLQSEQLCYSELYIIIMDISYQIEALPPTEMTSLVLTALSSRKSKLFDVELFNAAVFLDPRIKICMNAEQKEMAKKYITNLYKRMNSLKETPNETLENLMDDLLEGPSTSNNNLAKSFSEYLKTLDPVSPEPIKLLISQLNEDFLMYERQSRLDLDANIIAYWSAQKNYLSSIAEIILAIPSTQVSVERLFSSLKYILSDQRNRLSAANVEHILLVKVNGIFKYEQ